MPNVVPRARKGVVPRARKGVVRRARKDQARRPDPEPLETNDRPVVLVGMAAWVVAFVVLVVFFRHDLHRHHATYWLWSCGIGVAMGLYGLHFIAKRNRNRNRPG